eukprot:CAMPEP_0182417378 /NCGR_PEP_ID=MMETSP1167-20130531/1837_1 /TAXON_ID=2988 /ORGANISM="Mallomonas Sp, Strain CCMP3275" /LENGTH=671 /DNA_ID=CAMNT_0024590895 /DNA_START=298 /DNA_END=2314 /DNA_ORIENTATION=+
MAHKQEYRPPIVHAHSGPPMRNDVPFSPAALPPPQRFNAPTLDMNSRQDLRHENRPPYNDDGRRDPAFMVSHNLHQAHYGVVQAPNHNHSRSSPISGMSRNNFNSPPPPPGVPVLSKPSTRHMNSPSPTPALSNSSPTTPTTPDGSGNVPHTLTVQELKELTRRRLAREAGVESRSHSESAPHSREGSVCSADELSLMDAELYLEKCGSGGSGRSDREGERERERDLSDMMSSMTLRKLESDPSPRLQSIQPGALPQFPPLYSSEMSGGAGLGIGSSIQGNMSRLGHTFDSTSATSATGIHPGLSEQNGSFRPFYRDREMDPQFVPQSGLRKSALHKASREGGATDESSIPMYAQRSQSPPTSPRSLRARPKLSVPFPEPLTRQRSTSSDFSSSIPYETAESVLLTPTPCSPSTPRCFSRLDKYSIGDRTPQRRENSERGLNIERRDSFDMEIAMTREAVGLVPLGQASGVMHGHGLPGLKEDETGSGSGSRPGSRAGSNAEMWSGVRRPTPPSFPDTCDPTVLVGEGNRGHSVFEKTIRSPNDTQVESEVGADTDPELVALAQKSAREPDITGLESVMTAKTQSFSPIFLYDTPGPFTYSAASVTGTAAISTNRTTSGTCEGNSKDISIGTTASTTDLSPLLTCTLLPVRDELVTQTESDSSVSIPSLQG